VSKLPFTILFFLFFLLFFILSFFSSTHFSPLGPSSAHFAQSMRLPFLPAPPPAQGALQVCRANHKAEPSWEEMEG
jgi:hypothetical protein